jgi:AraC family transcriptional regulator of adaptative response / DNA-3-methyladenine glycosylase II
VCHAADVLLDSDRIWTAVEARDSRFDGWVFCGVTTTGIYCRPSCPARTPKRQNVSFHSSAAAAQAAGFRACKRCRPDAAPGSPEWDRRGDLVGRTMRLIADGVVDREGVGGLARRLGYAERHVHRELVAVLGVGPLAVARAQRAQTARILLETTDLPIIEVAYASGFRSVRQFNATISEIFATPPRELRRSRRRRDRSPDAHGAIVLRLPARGPSGATELVAFLAARAVPGVEAVLDGAVRRSLRLPNGSGVVELRPAGDHVRATFWLEDLRDLAAAVRRCRALLDLDSDPIAVLDALGGDALIGDLVRAAPGRRVPGHVDGHELATRAVLGQQISVAGAVTLAGRLVAGHGEPLTTPVGAVTHLFPSCAALADTDPASLPMPATRRAALAGLARALEQGQIRLDEAADREEARRRLLELPGIGPWTASYIAVRALRDPDAFMEGDLGVRRALERLGQDGRPAQAGRLSERWRPYRAYALVHLWALAAAPASAGAARGDAPRTRLAA